MTPWHFTTFSCTMHILQLQANEYILNWPQKKLSIKSNSHKKNRMCLIQYNMKKRFFRWIRRFHLLVHEETAGMDTVTNRPTVSTC